MIAVVLALACMFCAALNDLTFKLFTRRGAFVGSYVMAIGVVVSLFFWLINGCSFDRGEATSDEFWKFALLSGFFSVTANLLLIECMRHAEVGMCSAIYRLNLVPAAIMGILLFDESVGWVKCLGILLAGGSILFFLEEDRRSAARRASASMMAMQGMSDIPATAHKGTGSKMAWTILAMLVFAALLRASMGMTYKFGMNAGAEANSFLMISGWMWAVGGLAYHLITRKPLMALFDLRTYKWGVLSGLLISGIVYFLAVALREGEASVVLPIAQLSFIATAIMGVMWLNESIGLHKVFGLFCAVASILCLVLASGT